MAYGGGYAGGYSDAAVHTGGWPFVTVECAFATDPGATPTWTDISAYVREFTINRGRQQELGKFNSGRATLVLANEDRRFDPTYGSSPYSPNVIPMRRLRIRATYLANTYDLFYGFVDRWGQTYQGPQESLCNVDVTDGFKVLANIDLPASVYENTLRGDSPVHWYRLGEPSGSTVAFDRGSVVADATYVGDVALGASSVTTHDPDTSATFDGVDDEVRLPDSTAMPAGGWTAELWIRTSTTAATDRVLLSTAVSGVGITGVVHLGIVGSGGAPGNVLFVGPSLTSGTRVVTDGAAHHVVLIRTAAGALQVYLDGTLEINYAGYGYAGASTSPFWISRVNTMPTGYSPYAGVIDEVALYHSELSPATISAHNAAGRTPWVGDTSGARINRILDAAGWPAADRSIDTGLAILQSADLGGTALAALQKVEETEQGRLFMDTTGRVRFIARDSLLKSPYNTSQATFGDSGAELDFEELVIEPGTDQTIVNEARVSRSNGDVQVVTDTASQTKFLRRTRTVDGLLHQSDSTSRDLAYWIVTHYKDPITRVTRLRLAPLLNEANLFPQALGREITDRVTAKKRPQNLGSAIEQQALIEGIEHRVTPMHWSTSWSLSPAETQVYWIAGVAGASEAGQTTRAGF